MRALRLIAVAALALASIVATVPLASAWPEGGRPGPGGPPLGRRLHGPGPHAGDWLRKYENLPPKQQQDALENDPSFRRLPPERQERLRERLRNFNSLPPEQRERILQRMENWEHLTPQQQQRAKDLFTRFRQLPDDRRRMVHIAARDLREMDPAQRERVFNSDRFRNSFSPEEQELLRGITELGIGPGPHNPLPPNVAPPEER